MTPLRGEILQRLFGGRVAPLVAHFSQHRKLSRKDIADACPRETTDCLVTALRERGAERGLFIVVQKTSTLILQAFASLVDLEGERLVTHTELSFRGDNDESWQKAAHFLAEKLAAEGSEG